MPHTHSSSYQVLLAPPAGTTPVNNLHNIALSLFNRDPSSLIQSLVFGALHCDSGLLIARTNPHNEFYVGCHTTKNPGLYRQEHLVSVTTSSLLDLYARPEPLLPRGFQAAPRDQWAASFVVVTGDCATTTTTVHHHNALTLCVCFVLPFAISQGKYLEADYTLHSLLYLGLGADDATAPAAAAAAASSSPSSKHKGKRPRVEEEE